MASVVCRCRLHGLLYWSWRRDHHTSRTGDLSCWFWLRQTMTDSRPSGAIFSRLPVSSRRVSSLLLSSVLCTVFMSCLLEVRHVKLSSFPCFQIFYYYAVGCHICPLFDSSSFTSSRMCTCSCQLTLLVLVANSASCTIVCCASWLPAREPEFLRSGHGAEANNLVDVSATWISLVWMKGLLSIAFSPYYELD